MSETAEYTGNLWSIVVNSRLWCSGNTSASQGNLVATHQHSEECKISNPFRVFRKPVLFEQRGKSQAFHHFMHFEVVRDMIQTLRSGVGFMARKPVYGFHSHKRSGSHHSQRQTGLLWASIIRPNQSRIRQDHGRLGSRCTLNAGRRSTSR